MPSSTPNAYVLCLQPQSATPEDIDTWIQQASAIHDEQISYLEPVYIMNIIDFSPRYRSLILDNKGRLWVTTRSSSWVMEKITHHIGYSYAIWADYLKQALPNPARSMPYVYGNTIYLRIPVNSHRHADWLNISKCRSFELHMSISRTHNDRQMCHFDFHFDHNPNEKCRITFTKNCQTLFSQIALGMHLIEAWYAHHAQLLSKHFHRLSLECRNRLRERFAILSVFLKRQVPISSDIIANFVLYHTIYSYIEQNKSREVSTLLQAHQLDSHTLQVAIAQYRHSTKK